MPVIPFIVEQHAEQAANLWVQREVAVGAPNYWLANLAALDERLAANFEGLQVAGGAGWDQCAGAAEDYFAGEVFAAAVLAFAGGEADRSRLVLEQAVPSLARSRGVVSALGWLPYQQVEAQIQSLLASDSPVLRRMGIAASAVHRVAPRRALGDALLARDWLLRARALRAVGELGLVDLCPAVQQQLAVPDERCRFWAAWSAAMLSADEDGLAALITLVESSSPFAERAVQVVMRRLRPADAAAWQVTLAKHCEQLRLAVIAGGVRGDPQGVPWLIEQMRVPAVARVAGESFTLITGLDLTREHLDESRPEGFQSGPTEDPQDANVELDPDQRLPWPNLQAIQSWWQTHGERLSPGTRHLLGMPISETSLLQVLRRGSQRQRAAAAMELSMRDPGRPLFEVRAPALRQQELLGVE